MASSQQALGGNKARHRAARWATANKIMGAQLTRVSTLSGVKMKIM